jgi:hypothetical protein
LNLNYKYLFLKLNEILKRRVLARFGIAKTVRKRMRLYLRLDKIKRCENITT